MPVTLSCAFMLLFWTCSARASAVEYFVSERSWHAAAVIGAFLFRMSPHQQPYSMSSRKAMQG